MMKFINKQMNKKGFTLIELVIVIAILGLLAAVAIPRLSGSRTKAAISAHNSNVRTLSGAATTYLAEEGLPGSDLTWTSTGGTAAAQDLSTVTDAKDKWQAYMQTWPSVPAGTGVETVTGDYSVTISPTGLVTVSPEEISE